MMDETREDLANQKEVADKVQAWMRQVMPFGEAIKLVEIPTIPDTISCDYEVWAWHFDVGRMEVKCLSYPYTLLSQDGYGFMISRMKLIRMWALNKRGFRGVLVYRTSEDRIFLGTLDHLVKFKSDWEKVYNDTTNHGKGRREPQAQFVIPTKYFTEVLDGSA